MIVPHSHPRPPRRGTPSSIRIALGIVAFHVIFYLFGTLLSSMIAEPVDDVVGWLSVIVALVCSPLVTRALLGPRRDGQVFGLIWIPLVIVYGAAGAVSMVGILTKLNAMVDLGGYLVEKLRQLRDRIGAD